MNTAKMKTSVLIIAHNEEEMVGKCLNSVVNQIVKPNEIILVAHNCIDKTIEVAQEFKDIKIIKFNGPVGTVFPRIEGLEHISKESDVVFCLDGDCIAEKNWTEELLKILNPNNILVGTYIKFKGDLFLLLSNIFNRIKSKSSGEKATRWLWGGSFAFWNKDKELIKNTLLKTIDLSSKLRLSRNPEDFLLAKFLIKKRNIEITNKTFVTALAKEKSIIESFKRNRENNKNARKADKHF